MKIAAYLLYCMVWDMGIIGFASYLVFWRGHSGWWILAALVVSTMGGYSNDTFRDLCGLPKKETA